MFNISITRFINVIVLISLIIVIITLIVPSAAAEWYHVTIAGNWESVPFDDSIHQNLVYPGQDYYLSVKNDGDLMVNIEVSQGLLTIFNEGVAPHTIRMVKITGTTGTDYLSSGGAGIISHGLESLFGDPRSKDLNYGSKYYVRVTNHMPWGNPVYIEIMPKSRPGNNPVHGQSTASSDSSTTSSQSSGSASSASENIARSYQFDATDENGNSLTDIIMGSSGQKYVLPHTLTWYDGVDQQVMIVGVKGYEFDHWAGPNNYVSAEPILNLKSNPGMEGTYTAVFKHQSNDGTQNSQQSDQKVSANVETLPATDILSDSAVLTGKFKEINGGDCGFEYGKTTGYGTKTNGINMGFGVYGSAAFNLEPGTSYHYRAFLSNDYGISYGEDQTFTTLEYATNSQDTGNVNGGNGNSGTDNGGANTGNDNANGADISSGYADTTNKKFLYVSTEPYGDISVTKGQRLKFIIYVKDIDGNPVKGAYVDTHDNTADEDTLGQSTSNKDGVTYYYAYPRNSGSITSTAKSSRYAEGNAESSITCYVQVNPPSNDVESEPIIGTWIHHYGPYQRLTEEFTFTEDVTALRNHYIDDQRDYEDTGIWAKISDNQYQAIFKYGGIYSVSTDGVTLYVDNMMDMPFHRKGTGDSGGSSAPGTSASQETSSSGAESPPSGPSPGATVNDVITTGSVYVTSSPAGASIYIDGISQGKVTPATINDIVTGKQHIVTVLLNDYQATPQSFTVSAGQAVTVNVPLAQVQQTGTLYLSGDPSSVIVVIDGVDRGTVSQTSFTLPVGQHTVVVSKTNYITKTYYPTVNRGDQTNLNYHLDPEPSIQPPATGQLHVVATPSGASIYVDNVLKGTGGATVMGLSPGSHFVTVSMAGYQTNSTEVAISAGTTYELRVTLTVTPPQKGSLSVSSSPSGAGVYIGQNYQGVTPLTINNLDPGSYTVYVGKSSYITQTHTVSINPGQTANLNVELLPEASTPPSTTGQLRVVTTPAGADVYVDGTFKGTTPNIFLDILAGSRTVRIEKAGYQTYTTTVTITAGERTEITPTLTPNVSPAPVSPKPSQKLSISVSPTSVTVDQGGNAPFHIAVKDPAGNGVQGAVVTVIDNAHGGTDHVTTVAGGTCDYYSYPSQSGQVSFTASKAGYTDSDTVSGQITLNTKAPTLSVALNPANPTVNKGDSVTIRITVTNQNGDAVPGATVNIYDYTGGNSARVDKTTGSDGSTSYATTPVKSDVISIMVYKDGYPGSYQVLAHVTVNG